jgi:hypothetical protein
MEILDTNKASISENGEQKAENEEKKDFDFDAVTAVEDQPKLVRYEIIPDEISVEATNVVNHKVEYNFRKQKLNFQNNFLR